MPSPLPDLDPRLIRVLERAAARAGEDVTTYIGRAIATRVAGDLIGTGDPELDVAIIALRAGELSGETPGAETPSAANTDLAVDAVISDPERLRAVFETGLLDSDPAAAYDRITSMAVAALDIPGAAVSLIDDQRQFFCSAAGLPLELGGASEVPLTQSVCRYTVAKGAPLVVEDARTDPMLSDHPSVAAGFFVAYAGFPLIDADGHAVGTLCVWDSKPREWSAGHLQILSDLARMAGERVFGAASRAPSFD